MKSKNLNLLYIESVINKIEIKKYLLIMILGSISIFFTYNGKFDFFSTMILSLSSNLFVLFTLSIIIFNAIELVKKFEQNYLLISRFKNLKEFYKYVIINILIANSYLLFISIFFLISVVSFSCNGNFLLPSRIQYNIPFLITFIYFFLKFIILMLTLSILGAFIYILTNVFGVSIYFILIIISIYSVEYVDGFIRKSIIDFPINFINYLNSVVM